MDQGGLLMVTQSIGTRTRVGGSVDEVLQSGQGQVRGAHAPTCSSSWTQAYTILCPIPAFCLDPVRFLVTAVLVYYMGKL